MTLPMTPTLSFWSWLLLIVPATLAVIISSIFIFSRSKNLNAIQNSSSKQLKTPAPGNFKQDGDSASIPNRDPPKMPKSIDANLLGIQILHPPPEVYQEDAGEYELDIVAVHGLAASPATTWTAKRDVQGDNGFQNPRGNGQKAEYVNWLSHPDMLPSKLPNARIMAFNHDSRWYGEDAVSLRLDPLASSLLRAIIHERKKCPKRPLIIIGHSLGGLIIEKALLHHESSKHLIPALNAVILFGTPHAGTDYIGFAEILERIISTGTHIELALLRSLRPENEGILDTVNNFAEMANSNGISVDCFFETQRSVIAKMFTQDTEKAIIVDEKSATLRSWPCHPLRADHYTLNKFSDPKDGNWRVVQRVIVDRYEEAAVKVQSREGGDSLVPCSFVPYDKDPKFIGRVEILKELQKLHKSNGRVALHGIGGVGKSQIAIEYAHKFREVNPGSWVFWVFAGSVEKFEKAYKEIADTLKLPGVEDPKTDFMALVTKWLNQEAPKRSWLMILDNVDDINVLYDLKATTSMQTTVKHGRSSSVTQTPSVTRRALHEYLPQSGRGRMLITTRVRPAAFKLVGEHDRIVNIPMMSEKEALALLQGKLQSISDESERPACVELVNGLDRLPLAITQASAYIGNNDQMTVSDYLELFNEQTNQAELLQVEENGDIRRENDVPNAVANTWLLSFDQIAQKEGPAGKAAIRLLYTMAFLDRHGIPDWLLREKKNDLSFINAVGKLAAYCLIVVEKGRSSYGMHRLVQIVTRNKVEMEQETNYWKLEVLKRLENLFPSGEVETWNACEQLIPHFQTVKVYDLPEDSAMELRADLLSKKAHYDERKGMWDATRIGREEEVAARLKLNCNGPEHPKTLTALHKLGWAVWSLSQKEAAHDITKKVLTSRQQVLGPDHEDTLETLNNLAFITSDEELSKQALEGRDRVLGEHKKTAESLHNHAIILLNDGKCDVAMEFNEKAHLMMQKFYDPEDQDILSCRTIKSQILDAQSRFKEAAELSEAILAIREASLGVSHIDTISNLADCAAYCDSNKDYASAEKYALRCLDAREKHPELGPNHVGTLRVLSDLGQYQESMGKIDEAEKTYRLALSKSTSTLGSDDDETLACRLDLALLLLGSKKVDEALHVLGDFMVRAKAKSITADFVLDLAASLTRVFEDLDRWDDVEILWEALVAGNKVCKTKGPNHIHTIRSLNNLALVYKQQKKYQQAETLLRPEYERRLDFHGPVHLRTLFCCRQLQDVLQLQEKLDEVAILRQRETELCSTPELVTTKENNLHRIAKDFFSNWQLTEAEAIASEALKSRIETLGSDHIDTLKTRHLLGVSLLEQNKDMEAEVCFRYVYERRTKIVGPDADETLAALEDLIETLKGQEKFEEAAEFEKNLPAKDSEDKPSSSSVT